MKFLLLSIVALLLAFSAEAANPDYKAFRGSGVILVTTNPAGGTVTSSGQPYLLTNNQSTPVTLASSLNLTGAGVGLATFYDAAGTELAQIQAASDISVNVTNIVGLTHKAVASVVELNFNAGQRFSLTNRASAAMTLVETNGSDGQEMSVVMIGEASGGTSRVITIIPQLGHLVANLDAFGSVLATSFSFTLTNGNGAEISSSIRRLNGTNVMGIVTRQFAF
jgi:hypothetical protein